MEPKKYSRKEAKKLMNEYNLKWTWDSTLGEADIQCFCGEWFSNPTHGFVISYPLYGNIDITKSVKNPNFPNGRPLYKVPDVYPTNWWWRTYFNKEEYVEYIRDKVSATGSHTSFDEIWEKYKYPVVESDIEKFKNKPVGHVYRSKLPNKEALYKKYKDLLTDEEFKINEKENISNYEKVISLGLYTTPNPNLIQCPICEIVNSIGYWRTCIPLRYKIKENIRFKHYKLYKFLFRNKNKKLEG